jgi:hypothetical protein
MASWNAVRTEKDEQGYELMDARSNAGLNIIPLCLLSMLIYYPDKHNTWTLYVNLFTLPQHVSVVVFDHHQVEAQVRNPKWILILKILLLYYVCDFRLPPQNRWELRSSGLPLLPAGRKLPPLAGVRNYHYSLRDNPYELSYITILCF